jgi:hypothetical protein
MSSSSYPPGVTGSEWQIAGPSPAEEKVMEEAVTRVLATWDAGEGEHHQGCIGAPSHDFGPPYCTCVDFEADDAMGEALDAYHEERYADFEQDFEQDR